MTASGRTAPAVGALADGGIAPRTNLARWHALSRDHGASQVDDAARFFLVPGLAHCREGATGLIGLDLLTPLLHWMAEGVAPESLAGRIAPEPFLGADRFGPRH